MGMDVKISNIRSIGVTSTEVVMKASGNVYSLIFVRDNSDSMASNVMLLLKSRMLWRGTVTKWGDANFRLEGEGQPPDDLCERLIQDGSDAYRGYLAAIAGSLPRSASTHGIVWRDDLTPTDAWFIDGFRYYVSDCEIWWCGWAQGSGQPENVELALDHYVRKNFPASLVSVMGYDTVSGIRSVRYLDRYKFQIVYEGEDDPKMWAYSTLDSIVNSVRIKSDRMGRTCVCVSVRPDLVGELQGHLEADDWVSSYKFKCAVGESR